MDGSYPTDETLICSGDFPICVANQVRCHFTRDKHLAKLRSQIYLTENIVLSLSKTTLFRFQTLHEPHRRSITTY